MSGSAWNQAVEAAAKIAALSRWIDGSYPEGMDPELVMRRRTGKVGTEYGEVLDAIEAWTGENPRKGVHGPKEDVIKELLDVATCALGAVEHLTGNEGTSVQMLWDHVAFVYDRAGFAAEVTK